MSKERVLIIGGSSGMGQAAAELLANDGYRVVIAGRTESKLKEAAEQIGEVETCTVDLNDEEAVKDFFPRVGPMNHLVISAADFVMGAFEKLELSEAKRFFESKFWGQYRAAKYGAPFLKKGGSIVFFSGTAGQKPAKGLSVASAINGAIESLARSLALELAPLRVNAISPGIIRTPVWDGLPPAERDAFFQHAGSKLPSGRVGTPEDIAKAVRFCIECPFLTGEVISCDGGGKLI